MRKFDVTYRADDVIGSMVVCTDDGEDDAVDFVREILFEADRIDILDVYEMEEEDGEA